MVNTAGIRGWKVFFFLPRIFFSCRRFSTTNELASFCKDIGSNCWRHPRIVRARCNSKVVDGEGQDTVERRATRVRPFCQRGELSSAWQVLVGAISPWNSRIQKLLQLNWRSLFNLDVDLLSKSLRTARRGAAAGGIINDVQFAPQ